MEQRRRRPHPTRADQATTRPSNGARSTAIYNGTASPAPTPDQSRPEPTKQPPDPLTESDLLRFTMEQRRRRPHPTRADQATTRPSNGARSTAIYNGTASPAPTPEPTRADQATTRPSNGVRSTAIYNGTASPAPTPDQSRPEPTKQPPDPLTEPDLLRFTMEQRRRRPHPTRADQATTRPSNGSRSTAIYNGTASPAPTPDHEPTRADQATTRPSNGKDLLRFTMEQRRRRPHPTTQSRPEPTRATTRPSNRVRSTAIYNGTASPAPTPDQSRPSNHQTL